MTRTFAPLAAAALIAAGVLGDHAVAATLGNSGVVSAATTTTNRTTSSSTNSSATSAATIDALMEHAYSVAGPSVVYVKNVGVGSGSGVIYDSTGDIVTNAHVVSGAQALSVTLSSGKTYTATLVGTDTADDLAVIHISAKGLPAAHFASAGSYRVAQTVLAIGSPLGLQQSVTSGLISALGRTVQESNSAYLPNAIQTSAPINPGNSGGALVALDGSVVGIPTLEASDPQNNNGGAAQGIGFAVPSERITVVAHQLIATGRVTHSGRAYLGVAATDSLSQSQGLFGQSTSSETAIAGALVSSASGPAAQAGVQQGDVITALDGTAVSGEADLLTVLAHHKPGDTVTLTISRSGSTITLRVHLGELSAS